MSDQLMPGRIHYLPLTWASCAGGQRRKQVCIHRHLVGQGRQDAQQGGDGGGVAVEGAASGAGLREEAAEHAEEGHECAHSHAAYTHELEDGEHARSRLPLTNGPISTPPHE